MLVCVRVCEREVGHISTCPSRAEIGRALKGGGSQARTMHMGRWPIATAHAHTHNTHTHTGSRTDSCRCCCIVPPAMKTEAPIALRAQDSLWIDFQYAARGLSKTEARIILPPSPPTPLLIVPPHFSLPPSHWPSLCHCSFTYSSLFFLSRRSRLLLPPFAPLRLPLPIPLSVFSFFTPALPSVPSSPPSSACLTGASDGVFLTCKSSRCWVTTLKLKPLRGSHLNLSAIFFFVVFFSHPLLRPLTVTNTTPNSHTVAAMGEIYIYKHDTVTTLRFTHLFSDSSAHHRCVKQQKSP